MENGAIFFRYLRKCKTHLQQILTGLWNHNTDVLPAYVPVHSKTAQVTPLPLPPPRANPRAFDLKKKIWLNFPEMLAD